MDGPLTREDEVARYPRVLITEEGMRDGLQIERLGVTVEQKVELLNALSAAGLSRIVVGSFVSPKWTPQMADVDDLLGRLEPQPDVAYLALALNARGRERARHWTPPLTMPEFPETHLHLCPVFLKRNTNRTMAQQEEAWPRVIKEARAAGAAAAGIGISAGWGSNWTGRFTRDERVEQLQRQFDAWSSAGITVKQIMLADPMGWNVPSEVGEDLRVYKKLFPTISRYHLHLHNTRGMALPSMYAALIALGPDDTLELDTGIGGMGGCPYCGNGRAAGMVPTEDLVQMLEAIGVPTGVDLYKLVEASLQASQIVGRELDGRVSMAGPLPDYAHLYDEQLPVIETLAEAQHFRLGPSVHAGRNRPWDREPVTPSSPEPTGKGTLE